MKRLTIRTSLDIPAPLHRQLHEAAMRRGCSARQLILRSIERLVEEESPQSGKRAQLPLVPAAGRKIQQSGRAGRLRPFFWPTAVCGSSRNHRRFDERFRALSLVRQPSPKLWADAYLAAHAAANEATLVTFDQAFASYGVDTALNLAH